MSSIESLISGRYVVQEKLGEGGMGIVFRAEDRLTGETVALKRVTVPAQQLDFQSRVSLGKSDNFRLALAQEFKVLASLRHPHIISVLDYGFDAERRPFLTMELLEDAPTLLEAGRDQPREQQIALLVQLLQALAYLHRRGIIHRDLKSDNVLVIQDRVKVLDFGLAVAREHIAEQTGDVVGTLAYMAPEVLAGEPASEASDLYAVGVMAFELLAGRHPYNTTNLAVLMKDMLAAEPDVEELGLNEEAAGVIKRLLAKQPVERYRNARELINIYAKANRLPELMRETQAIRESYLQAAQFVGRESELGQLVDAFCAAAQVGQGSGWLVGGESGVGKTRLLDEFRIRVLVEGALVLWGQAISEGSTPYQEWRQVLRRLCLEGELSDLEAGVLKAVVPDISRLLGRTVSHAPGLEPGAAYERLLKVIIDIVYRQSQPLVIILEDMQWAGSRSIALLNRLTRNIRNKTLLIVASYRDDERPDLPSELPAMQRIKLPRLSEENIATLSESMLGAAGKKPELVEFLQRETEGNTFFIIEIVRVLAEEAGRLDRISRMSLPRKVFARGIEKIVRRRLNRVPEHARALLQVAAISGRHLDLKILQAVEAKIKLSDWLNVCAEAMIIEVQDDQWRFVHDKLREGLRVEVDLDKQKRLHQRVAMIIEQTYTGLDNYAPTLAYHWLESGNAVLATPYIITVSEQALQNGSLDEALTLIQRTLDLIPEQDHPARYDLLLAREHICDLQGERQVQQQDLIALQELAEILADDRRRAEVRLRHANYAEATGDFPAAIAAAQAAIKLAQVIQDVAGEATGFLEWGRALWRQGDYKLALPHLEQALVIARANQLSRIEARCLLNLSNISWSLGHYAEAKMYDEQALFIYHKIGDRQGEGTTLMNLGIIAEARGDHTAAQAYYEQALVIMREIGRRVSEGDLLNNLGIIFDNLGDYETGRTYYEQALPIYREIGDRQGESIVLTNLGLLFHHLGDDKAAYEYNQQALRTSRVLDDHRNEGFNLNYLGHAALGLGNLDEAADSYRRALNLRRELGESHLMVDTLAGLARTSLAQGDLSQAQSFTEEILSYLETNPPDGIEEPLRVYLTCYRVLQAIEDPRAGQILGTAYRLLQAQATRISDEALACSFLENVAAHRELVAEWTNRETDITVNLTS